MQAPTPKILLALGRRTAVGPSLSLLKHPHKLHFLSSISLCSSSTRKNHKPKKNPSSLFPRFLKNLPKIQMKAENNESCGELKKGPWTAAEDAILMEYVRKHGEGNWNSVQKNCGLMRCGKSCRLRWTNHLRPNLKKGAFSPEEERVILEMHAKLGNKWARMAAQLPGRTDNEIKNYWNTRLKRRQRAGTLPFPQGMHKQGAHNHQPYSSPVPTPTIQFSSLHQPNYGSLSIFDQINMSPLTSLQSHQQFQSNGIGFSLPFSSNLSPISTPQNQSFQTQCAQASTYQFSSNNYNLYSSPYLRTSFEPDGIGPPAPSSAFSIKLELPSSQLSEAAATTAALGTPIDYNISLPLPRSNSGLLDALVQEGTAMPSGTQHKLEENCDSDALGTNNLPCGGVFSESNTNPPAGARSQWVDFNPTDEVKMKKEPIDELASVEGDLSSMLDIIPSTMSIPNWGYSNSSEISNGQSSALTDDDINLEMQQLVSSLPPMNTTDQNWTLGIWNNMPRIC